MTLRLKLLLLLVGIVATGLVVSDVVTYTALNRFLVDRVDQQLAAATFPVERALTVSTTGTQNGFFPAPGFGATQTATSVTQTAPGTSGAAPGRPAGPDDRRSLARGQLVPPGTFGELLAPDGKVISHQFFTYGGAPPTTPNIPATLPAALSGPAGSSANGDVYFNVTSPGSASVTYRAIARQVPTGGTVLVAIPLSDVGGTLHHLLVVELVVTLSVLAGLGVLSWVMVRRDLRPLAAMTDTASKIAAGDLSRRVTPDDDHTEVGRLGGALNGMLTRIEDAFAARTASEDRLRRFVADASHELRTPLTSIRGYTELFEMGVKDRPEDLATAMHHIRGEAERMRVLVEDLLLLAHPEHVRVPATDRVDLAEVASQAVAGARVAAPDRHFSLSSAAPVFVTGDAYRLRQVLDNLIRNAVEHGAGDVAVTVGAADDVAVLAVRDHGPGIAGEDAGRIFEPFYRADPSRSRGTGGAGLGLAIVAGIVESHGGSVAVESATGNGGPGAVFTVRLPRAGADDEASALDEVVGVPLREEHPPAASEV